MTNITKNRSTVFAFAALLMAMPFATGNAFAEVSETTSVISGFCGYSVPTSLTFDDITPGTTTELTATFEDWTVVENKNGVSRVLVSATDWIGAGDRATGTITIDGVVKEGEVVEVNGEIFTAKDNPTGTNEFISSESVSAEEVAESLAAKLRDNTLTSVRTSTAGTNEVTIQSENRGTEGNDITITAVSVSFVLSGETLTGGGDNPETHLVAENTHYSITTDGNAAETDYTQMSAFKTSTASAVTPLEIIGGTDVRNPLKVNLAIDASIENLLKLPYEGSIVQTLDFTITCDGTLQ